MITPSLSHLHRAGAIREATDPPAPPLETFTGAVAAAVGDYQRARAVYTRAAADERAARQAMQAAEATRIKAEDAFRRAREALDGALDVAGG